MPPDMQMPHLTARSWQALFQSMLPTIQNCVQFAFRHMSPDLKEEAVQAALANACVACERLVAQGRAERVFPSALARFAVAQVHDGRLVGTPLTVWDVLSPYAQRKKHLVVKRLDSSGEHECQWLESVRQDHRTPVPDQVWFRIDFPEWLASLSWRHQQIAKTLASGHTTNEVARQFSISAGRVSQLRREFNDSWRRFHGELNSTSAHTVND
jgi:hypothetical protein